MTKTLVVYHSRTGYTRRAAKALTDKLDADLEEVKIVQPLSGPLGYAMCAIEAVAGLAPALRPSHMDPAAYDLVVVGTPVWFWSLSSPMRSWLEKNPLKDGRFAFFCTMGSSGATCVFATMKQLAGGEPIATLALTDSDSDAAMQAKLESFVRALQATRRRGSAGGADAARAGA